MTLREAIAEASTRIDPRDAELLLLHLLDRDKPWFLAHSDDPLPESTYRDLQQAIARRATREPLQYITGRQEFYGLTLRVTPDVLIPRPETEHLVEAVELWATQFHDGRTLHLADIGTGSGAIAIALATHLAGVQLTAIDLSEAALAVAQSNAQTHACADRITFLHNDLLANIAPETFDAIVSNPPYVPSTDAPMLQPEVRDHEPHTALFAGPSGLDIYRRLIPEAHTVLKPHGLLALEFGFGQRDALAHLLEQWHNVRFLDDYAGIPRIALAEK